MGSICPRRFRLEIPTHSRLQYIPIGIALKVADCMHFQESTANDLYTAIYLARNVGVYVSFNIALGPSFPSCAIRCNYYAMLDSEHSRLAKQHTFSYSVLTHSERHRSKGPCGPLGLVTTWGHTSKHQTARSRLYRRHFFTIED